MLDNIYRLDAPLGKGGVGVVFKAWHLHLQRPCAIKFLHPQLVSNPELRTRFRREAQSAFQLGHPHIVAITDFRDDPSSWPYLVMELVQGQSLRDRLEKGPLDPQLAVRLMSELADALVAAHRRGVIHRDLKPENLLLGTVENPAPGEPDLCLKVLDFGLSKMLDGVEITGTGRLVGSPSYMAPEQARGDSNIVDARSDIWSVGVLLYECLTADKLFATDDFEQKRQQIMSAKLPPLHFTEKGLPPLIEKIITRCCQRLPEHRYQSATALLSALSAVYPKPAPRLDTLPPGARITGGVVVVPSPLSSTPIAETMTTEPNRAKSSGPEVVVIPAFVKSMLPDNSTASIIKNGEMVADRAAREKPKRSGVGIALALATVALAFTGFAGYTLWQSRQSLPIGTANAGLLPDKLSTSGENPTLTAGTKSNNVGTGNAAIVEAPTRTSASASDGAVTADLQPPSSIGGPVTVADAATPSEKSAGADTIATTATTTTSPAPDGIPSEPPRPHSPSTLPLRGPRAKAVGSAPTHPLRFGPPKFLHAAAGSSGVDPSELPPPAASVPFATPANKAPTPPTDSSVEPVPTQEAAGAASAIFRKATGAVGRCFPAEASLPTKISVEVTISASGKVSEVSVDGADSHAACVRSAVKALRFGAISDADSYSVQYDFVNLHR